MHVQNVFQLCSIASLWVPHLSCIPPASSTDTTAPEAPVTAPALPREASRRRKSSTGDESMEGGAAVSPLQECVAFLQDLVQVATLLGQPSRSPTFKPAVLSSESSPRDQSGPWNPSPFAVCARSAFGTEVTQACIDVVQVGLHHASALREYLVSGQMTDQPLLRQVLELCMADVDEFGRIVSLCTIIADLAALPGFVRSVMGADELSWRQRIACLTFSVLQHSAQSIPHWGVFPEAGPALYTPFMVQAGEAARCALNFCLRGDELGFTLSEVCVDELFQLANLAMYVTLSILSHVAQRAASCPVQPQCIVCILFLTDHELWFAGILFVSAADMGNSQLQSSPSGALQQVYYNALRIQHWSVNLSSRAEWKQQCLQSRLMTTTS